MLALGLTSFPQAHEAFKLVSIYAYKHRLQSQCLNICSCAGGLLVGTLAERNAERLLNRWALLIFFFGSVFLLPF